MCIICLLFHLYVVVIKNNSNANFVDYVPQSIYGEKFADENFILKHTGAGK